MSDNYSKKIGRITLYRHGVDEAVLRIPTGWNDGVQVVENVVTTEELRDLRYMIDRLLAKIDAKDVR